MKKPYKVEFSSSLTELSELNSSFDMGVLRICYTGENRNKSYFSREDIERHIDSIHNCPIVCNYDRELNELGGHDVELVCDDDGGLRLVNMTQPVGVIPESARVWFEEFTEEDGTVHEYLYSEALLWKRQEAYRKIKEDGFTKQSMEINIANSEMVDGVLHIKDFEFTAFALIGVNPCFESAGIELFSYKDFKEQMSEMMKDLKESFNLVISSDEDDNKKSFEKEGGDGEMDTKKELAMKYGIDLEALDFSLDDFTEEELIEKFEAMTKEAAPVVDEDVKTPEENFELASQSHEWMAEAVKNLDTTRTVWGEDVPRYWYEDHNADVSEVYCTDRTDWHLYGFTYVLNGDAVAIDIDSKKRMKMAIVPFDGEEKVSPVAQVYEEMSNKISSLTEYASKFDEASKELEKAQGELETLRQFKLDVEEAKLEAERNAIFEEFKDLEEIEAFASLKENKENYSVDELRKECFAIRGEFGVPMAKFSLQETPKQKVIPPVDTESEPYGGLFVRYGTDKN